MMITISDLFFDYGVFLTVIHHQISPILHTNIFFTVQKPPVILSLDNHYNYEFHYSTVV